MKPVPFRLGSRWGRAVELAAGEHVSDLDRATLANWQAVASSLGEGHCPNCGSRLERREQWAHCGPCRMCWQLGRDHESGQPTIAWMHDCLHDTTADLARFFRLDDTKELIRKYGTPAAKRDILLEEE